MAAIGATLTARSRPGRSRPGQPGAAVGRASASPPMLATPALLDAGGLHAAAAAAAGPSPGMGRRAARHADGRADPVPGDARAPWRAASPARSSSRPSSSAFYLAIARSMHIPIGFAELAVIVPISFIVQMLPVSMNGFGVREATFGFYFTPSRPAARVGAAGVLRRRGADHAVLAVGRGGLPRPTARWRRGPRQHLISLTAANSAALSY